MGRISTKVKSQRRVCILPVEVAGYQEGLEEGLSALGWSARAITISNHPFKYSMKHRNPIWAHLVCESDNFISKQTNTALKLAAYLLALPLRAFGSIWVSIKFDIVVLNCGRSLLPLHIDLLIYRLFRIRIYAMMGHGSEARPPCIDCLGDSLAGQNPSTVAQNCDSRKKFVRRVEKLADFVISTPTIGHYFKKPFLNNNDIGIPVRADMSNKTELNKWVGDKDTHSIEGSLVTKKLNVVHIPSNPRIKGSAEIERVLKLLEQEGLVEARVITGLTHSEVRELLNWSDLLVDQLYSDIPLPVLATEAALQGVPTVIGSNDWEYIKNQFRPEEWPPAFHIHPKQLEMTIRAIQSNPKTLVNTAEAVQNFATTRRTAIKVASIYQNLFLSKSGKIDEIRYFSPSEIRYLAGCGSSEEVLKEIRPLVHQPGCECWET
jgi:hypothetical protein